MSSSGRHASSWIRSEVVVALLLLLLLLLLLGLLLGLLALLEGRRHHGVFWIWL